MTDTLLLRIRLESLRNSFAQVGALREAMTSSNVGVERLQRLLAGADPDVVDEDEVEAFTLAQRLFKVDDVLSTLVRLLGRNLPVNPQNLAPERITEAREHIAEIEKILIATQEEAEELWQDVNDWAYLGSRGQAHAPSKATAFTETSNEVEELIGQLKRGGDAMAAWQSYRNMATVSTPPLFRGYVDIASGLTLRGRRLDERVCAMADDLVKDWSPYLDLTTTALTIPAFDDEEQPSHMVRFGFAAWTVWSLPLFAGTFWRMFADNEHPGDLNAFAEDPQVRRRARTYFGDCLAVEMMGPAYACALILLRLDPAQTRVEGEAVGFDGTRAQVVLDTMRPKAKRERSYSSEIFDLLEGAWADAQELAGHAGACGDVDIAASVVAKAKDVVADFGDRPGRLAPVDAERWERTRALAGTALSGAAPREAEKAHRERLTPLLKTSSVVDVLNAAWRRRLLPDTCDPPAPLPDRPAEEARRLATRVSTRVWPSLPPPTAGAAPGGHQRSTTGRG